jgi:TetR/AcrR family transcriptional repressor of bet genes
MPENDAKRAAKLAAGMIDGLWLRAVLSKASEQEFKQAEQLAKHYVSSLILSCGA